MAHYPPSAPGRLGDPTMSVSKDPRTHPKLLAAVQKEGMHETTFLTPEFTPDAPKESIIEFCSQAEKGIEEVYRNLDYTVTHPSLSRPIDESEERIVGPDGNEIKILMYRPAGEAEPIPALLYFHGGGMIMLRTDNPMHIAWSKALAQTGLHVFLVDFRNALHPGGLRPFPAGLNDCVAAVRWIRKHSAKLNINKIVLHGESGGGNLALATALKANSEGWQDEIDGVCATDPYISGAYNMPSEWKLRELPSLVELDGYLVMCSSSSLHARIYDDFGKHARDKLAWPYWAEEEDMRGLPPHLIVTAELDPLRDEGNAYYRKLARAGVSAVGRVSLGVVHSGELFLRKAAPEIFLAHLWDIKAFVDRL
ncbi:unnamed protein product [Zymoseptoria tritici ST99CH_1A5]|uniref:Alpha/beta hydrolase fold-3 domain-containing protein n=2 Tax=Zymoseptoria tritici TaxID=1047171 RepID=A0A1Y6L7Y8_ZYMTR|nr:unnamed protein product [Zymoseptoria tritici ST99CH_1A5]